MQSHGGQKLHSLQIFRCCVHWLSAGAWASVSLAVAIGYLAIAKIQLIKLLYKALDNGVVMYRAPRSSRPGAEAVAHQSSSENRVQTPRVARQRGSENRMSTSAQPSGEAPHMLTETAPEQLDALPCDPGALDWTSITCQNGQGCTRTAAYVVELHAVDHCSSDATNLAGNVIEILCGMCLAKLRKSTSWHVARLNSRGQRPNCLTCGAPIELTSDILRSVRLLDRTVPLPSPWPKAKSTTFDKDRKPRTAARITPRTDRPGQHR